MTSAQASQNSRRVYVLGVGMTKFEKPGARADFDYPVMVRESVTAALKDSQLRYNQIQQAFCGYVYGDSTCGQRAVYEVGLTGIPVVNVNNNCSTGATAIFLARQAILAGLDCVLAVGFEKMEKGSLQSHYSDRTNPLEKHVQVLADKYGVQGGPIAAQLFGAAAQEYSEKYGVDVSAELEWIAYKNHKHSVNNSRSQFRDEYTIEQIRAAPKVAFSLTKLQCCPTSDGSAAAVLISDRFLDQLLNGADRENVRERAVELLDMQMATDLPSSFEERSCMKMVGYDMSKTAADRVYANTGLKPSDFAVVELHDCFSANEFITYEALGLTAPGTAKQLVAARDVTYGGKYVVNPSGGLISKGHPLGATGLAQCAELCWQLRGEAGKRQVVTGGVPPRFALQHNIGLGGAAVVAAYRAPVVQRIKPEAGTEAANAKPVAKATQDAPTKASGSDAFKVLTIFEMLRKMAPQSGDIAQKWVGAVGFRVRNTVNDELRVLVRATGTGASRLLEVVTDVPSATLIETEKQKSSCVIDIGDDDLAKVFSGEAKGQQLYFSGKMKVKGDITAAMQLQKLQVAQPKL